MIGLFTLRLVLNLRVLTHDRVQLLRVLVIRQCTSKSSLLKKLVEGRGLDLNIAKALHSFLPFLLLLQQLLFPTGVSTIALRKH